MHTVRVLEKTGKDGVLHLHIPVGQPEAEFEAVIELHPKGATLQTATPDERGWPPGYFEKTFGSIDDPTFERPPQDGLPNPVELD